MKINTAARVPTTLGPTGRPIFFPMREVLHLLAEKKYGKSDAKGLKP
ncbi:MAG: hypothetical protein ABIZ36_08205 [Gemmatimonadaceae bacterium]